MVGDFFGSIGDSINQDKGFIFGLANNAISYAQSKKAQRRAFEYAKLLQQQQYDLSIRGYKEAPSAQRTGLESAGYNPMLALGKVGDGVSVAGGTPVNANSTDSADLAGAAATIQSIKNQTEQTEASTDQMYAEADKAKVEKATMIERLPYISKQAKADYLKTSMESAKLENDIHYQNEYLNYLEKSLQVQQRLGEMGFANAKDIANINAAASRYSVDKPIEITKDKDKRYKEWGSKHPLLRNVDETLSRYFNGFGYNASSVYKGR